MNKQKKVILVFLIILVTFSLALVGYYRKTKENKTPSTYSVGKKYNQAITGTKPVVVLFYVDWCTYCKKFIPKFEQLSKKYKDKYDFSMVDLEEIENKSKVNEYDISSFPTVYIIDPAIDNQIYINQQLTGDINKLKKELDRYLRVRAMIKQ